MAGSCFIDTQELTRLMAKGDRLYILDGTLLAAEDPKTTFLRTRIPGARYFDQTEIRDKNHPHPLAYPSVEQFQDYMVGLRVPNNGSLVVVYDQAGMMTAPRAWFLLKYFGYTRVKFLNGGLPKWEAEKRPVVGGPVEPFTSPVDLNDYKFAPRRETTVQYEQVRDIVQKRNAGQGEEILWDPRNPKITPGTLIPHSLNFFYQHFLNKDMTIRPQTEIRAIMEQAGIDLTKPIVATCNRGMMACSAYLILTHIGKKEVVLNPGSFTEWSRRAKL